MRRKNPFVFGEVVRRPQFVDREQEIERLQRDLADVQKVFLLSPRRFSKGSLVGAIFEQLGGQGIRTVTITVRSLAVLCESAAGLGVVTLNVILWLQDRFFKPGQRARNNSACSNWVRSGGFGRVRFGFGLASLLVILGTALLILKHLLAPLPSSELVGCRVSFRTEPPARKRRSAKHKRIRYLPLERPCSADWVRPIVHVLLSFEGQRRAYGACAMTISHLLTLPQLPSMPAANGTVEKIEKIGTIYFASCFQQVSRQIRVSNARKLEMCEKEIHLAETCKRQQAAARISTI